MSDVLCQCHPVVALCYFCVVLGTVLFAPHPAYLLLSLALALGYRRTLCGRAKSYVALPLVLLAAVIAPLFHHEGVTVLLYFPNGNPLTLESVLAGLASAVLLATSLCWFACLGEVLTTDKLICLFGALTPALSLLLSMILRLIPRLRDRLALLAQAQRGLAHTPRTRVRDAMRLLSALTTYALEHGIGTADSMKARGYGLPGRTAYHPFVWDDRDRALVLWFGLGGCFVGLGGLAGGLQWHWYPFAHGAPLTPLTVLFFLIYTLLCATPLMLNAWEVYRCTHSR